MSKQGNFQGHVEGMRAVAIILVVLFHLNGAVWAHGYLGVDVFLVISGYLLFRSRLSAPGVESVKVAGLYLAKRVRRIVPPMAIIILLTLTAGAFLMQPEDEIFAGRVAYSACLAKSNVFLQHELAYYFAPESQFNPLLHLWYLSVALQIYLIWAVGNQFLQRLPKRLALGILVALGAASLAYHYKQPLCELITHMGYAVRGHAVSYYATLPRLWEVLAGGLVCCLPTLPGRHTAGMAAGLGLAAVLLCALVGVVPGTTGAAALPGTLITVVGTVLALRYAPDTSLNKILSNKAMLWLGRISFSVYLVHMPIIVMGKLWVYGDAGVGTQILLLVCAVALGWLYWWSIEKRRCAWWLLLLLWVEALMLGRYARKLDGFQSLVPLPSVSWAPYQNWQLSTDEKLAEGLGKHVTPNKDVFDFLKQKAPSIKIPLMNIGDVASIPPSFVLMGDSHAMCSYSGLNEALRGHKSGVFLTSVVLPYAGLDYWNNPTYYFTPPKQAELLHWLKSHPELSHVIIAQRWTMWSKTRPHVEKELREFLHLLRDAGKKVILLGPVPEYTASNTLHYQRTAVMQGLTLEDISPTSTPEEYSRQHKRMLTILQRLEKEGLCTLIRPTDALSEGEVFHASQGSVSYMIDTNHLSPAGSAWLMQKLRSKLLEALEK